MTNLNDIAQHTFMRILEDQRFFSSEDLKKQCRDIKDMSPETGASEDGLFRFGQALKKNGICIVSEILKSTPERGVISGDFPYLAVARELKAAGTDCLSFVTEPYSYGGSDDAFAAVRADMTIPMLRSDVIIDEYQIYQSKTIGADAVLLLCGLLDRETVRQYLELCSKLEMDAAVEVHSKDDAKAAAEAGAKIILADASDQELCAVIPEDRIILLALRNAETLQDAELTELIRKCSDRKNAAVFISGEIIMESGDRKGLIRSLKGSDTVTEEQSDETADKDIGKDTDTDSAAGKIPDKGTGGEKTSAAESSEGRSIFRMIRRYFNR